MAQVLGEHFTYKKLFKAVVPSILMMIFTSIYSVVDGVFVSNFVGASPFAGLNLIMPVIMILGSIGFMMGTGGSALVAKTLGEGDEEKANKIFSMVIYFSAIAGIIISAICFIFIEDIANALGGNNATQETIKNSITYGRILIAANFMFILQNTFQAMFIAAEKPMLGFIVTVVAGITNMILDAVFILVFKWGLVGAAVATVMSYVVGGIVPIFYFISKKNNSLLKLVKTKIDFKAIWQSCFNGSSELLSNISSSIVSMLFNMQLLKVAGDNGVAAYGIIMYLSFVFQAIFVGYAIGVAPITSYNHGAENYLEVRNVLKKSLIVVSISGVVMTILTIGFATPLSSLFTHGDKGLLDLTSSGMRLYGISFLLAGLNIYASSFFTSLNDGLVSAVISFARTLVFQVIAILVMPILFGTTGIWLSIVVAEVLAIIVSIVCLIVKKKKYRY